MNSLKTNLRTFAPEFWGEVDHFAHFYSGTYALRPEAKKCISGIKGHFDKAVTITQLLEKLAPGLKEDNDHLNEHGFTPANNGREFSAVAESVFTELYSSVDCARKVVTDIFRGCRRMPDSTRKLFKAIADDIVGAEMPDAVKAAFRNAAWYPRLMTIRDELTHADIGNTRLEGGSSKIVYTHFSIKINGQPLVIPDLMAAISEITSGVNTFLGQLFGPLNAMLKPTQSDQLCGFFNGGLAYMRRITNERPVTFHSGICLARQWYESDPAKICPFAGECQAYTRTPSPPASTVVAP